MMRVFQKYPPKPPRVQASTKFTGFTELKSANGFAVTSSGSLTAVETMSRSGYKTRAAKNASARYLASTPTRREDDPKDELLTANTFVWAPSRPLPQPHEHDSRDEREERDQHRKGRAVAGLVLLERRFVGVGGEHLAGVARAPAGHDEDDIEDREAPDQGHGRHHRELRGDLGDDHVPGPLEPVGPVDHGRLHGAYVHVLERRVQYQEAETRRPPDRRDKDRVERGVRVGQPAAAQRVEAYGVEDGVQGAEQGMVDPLPPDPNDHQRQHEREKEQRPEKERTALAPGPHEERLEEPEYHRRDRPYDDPDHVVDERLDRGRVPEHPRVVGEPDEVPVGGDAVPVREAQVDRGEEREEHEDRVDQQPRDHEEGPVVGLRPAQGRDARKPPETTPLPGGGVSGGVAFRSCRGTRLAHVAYSCV